jgi:YesN/AraC family two-component response regulator
VIEARDGDEALRLCAQHAGAIELMVTDIVMPQVNGRQLAERLQVLRPALRVLFLSGYTDDAVVHHGVLSRGAAFLQKPFAPEALARKVREMLDSHEQ